MKTIKFSHYYFKMSGFQLDEPFTLVRAESATFDTLSKSFIEYDTTYLTASIYEGKTILPITKNNYPLPKGRLIILYLMQRFKIMTTVRRYTVDKYNYYSNLVGSEVMVEIVKKADFLSIDHIQGEVINIENNSSILI